MQLDERKQKILEAIIHNYMESGEPVGSRTVSKYTDLNLSSATIRNEMADLEEMGYILQPHTSAGRIPSDKAYRLYVDTVLGNKEKEVEDMKGGPAAGGKAVGGKYELHDDGFQTEVRAQKDQIYPAESDFGSADTGDRCFGQQPRQ